MSVKKEATGRRTNLEVFRWNGVKTFMLTTAFLLMTLVPACVSAQQKPTTGYAPACHGKNRLEEVPL